MQAPSSGGFCSVPAAKEQLGAIIGPQGSVVKRLEESSGARVSIVDSDPPSVAIYAGSQAALRACEAEVLKITGGHIKVCERSVHQQLAARHA